MMYNPIVHMWVLTLQLTTLEYTDFGIRVQTDAQDNDKALLLSKEYVIPRPYDSMDVR